MRLYAFRGIRYGEGISDRGSLAAPPYDQIDAAFAARLRETPHQFAWLTRPIASGRGNPYETASKTHEAWLQSGTLQQDESKALYPYEVLLPGGGRRLGLTALIGLEDPEGGVIRPHERTVERTVDERLDLLRATDVDLEPILLLSDDDGGLDSLLTDDLRDGTFMVEHQDSFGNRHRLYRLDDADRIEQYRGLLASSPGLIADGHHRYEVALRHANERGQRIGSDKATKLAVVTSLKTPGLTIDPIHRGLLAAIDLDSAADLAKSRHPCDAASGVALAAAVAAQTQPALAVLAMGRQAEIWSFEQAAAPAGLLSSSSHLAVGWLHDTVLPRLGLDTAAARDGRIVYRSDPEQLLTAIGRGDLTAGFVLPPMSPQEFSLATAQKALLPPKSTRFLPKIVSGLVWASLNEEGE
jgi:uncharacterized protein (DUF1015 family)